MAILKLTDICKDYVQGKEPVRVLKNVNLTVEQGQYLAIMGPSGSGKTTLMNLIGCLDVPTSGSLELDGKDLKDLTDDQLADIRNRHIGFVFQSFHLLPKMDALENVALPLLYAGVPLKERRARAEEALKAVGLEERIHFMPNQLSGGQCQRVAIARAMVTKPALLLADEPTGALDTKAGNQIMEIFRQLSREGMTIIMITHEQSIADCADKIYYILDGELDTGEGRRGGNTDEAEI
jgi:putative ABC transport system ATP-binding protein